MRCYHQCNGIDTSIDRYTIIFSKDWHIYCVTPPTRQISVANDFYSMYRSINIFSFICIALLARSATAADFQTHASIYDTASRFMLDHVASRYELNTEIKPGTLDSRLTLRQCTKPLEASLPTGSRGIGKITVAVKCTDHKPWSLHVPITVSLYQDILVAKESLPRGKLLEKDDLKRSRYDLARLTNGYISQFDDSVGMKLKRPLTAGAALTPGMLEKPVLVQRGQRVTILAQSGGMVVRTSGKALAHGAAGERIGIINIKSRLKLEGVVTASGEVEVDI